jgi:DNA replication protein DnaC
MMNSAVQKHQMSDGNAPPGEARTARALTQADLLMMRLPERFWNASIDKVPAGKSCFIVQQYLRKINEVMAKGIGLLLHGANGVGKTSAAAVIIKHARRHGHTALFMRAAELLKSDLHRTYFDPARTQTIYQRACSVKVLVIDDLGKEHHPESGFMAGYATDLLEDIIRERSARLLSTIITTNMDPKRIGADPNDPNDGDVPQLYKRSMKEVMGGNTVPVKFAGVNQRVAEANENLKLLVVD